MGFFEPSVMGRGHHNFVVIALMIIKFGTVLKLDVSVHIGNKEIGYVTNIT